VNLDRYQRHVPYQNLLDSYQYAIPITHARSSSTKARTYSTIAFGAGKSWVNSLKPSAAQIAITLAILSQLSIEQTVLVGESVAPIRTRATKAPAGPATSIDGPPLLKMPPPITALMTMNCSQLCQLESRSDRSLRWYHTKIIHPWRFCLRCVSLVPRHQTIYMNATNFNFGGFASADMIAAPCTSSRRQKKLPGST
jgi:hypothetical protein